MNTDGHGWKTSGMGGLYYHLEHAKLGAVIAQYHLDKSFAVISNRAHQFVRSVRNLSCKHSMRFT